ncbi:YdeI/OmpD-associated family protein [Alkalibacterium sp. f15]|uniref:YdeI/OmpD-associated family protein n=1 Tax=Alkalibacterium sp. f15 TaxID=3414029 RepID=UPI003BF8BB5F
MDITNLIEVKTRQELRAWLEENAATETFCWIVISSAKQIDGIHYLDAVEEALCFGWIDGIRKTLPSGKSAQRFSPRRKNSNWTELNKERVRRLEKMGLMKESGRQVLPDMSPSSFKIDPEIEERLKADEDLYHNFLALPELYRRIRLDNIQGNENQPDLFNRRLDKFILNTRDNKLYGQWNDNGRLIDY